MKKIRPIKSKKNVIYAKKDLILMMIIKSIIKSEVIVTTQKNIKELLIIFIIEDIKLQKKIPIVFHNGSTYDYHYLIKECLRGNTEKYITFSAPIKKRTQ